MKSITPLGFVLFLVALTTNSFAFSKNLAPFDEIILSGNVSALLIEGEEASIEIQNDEDRIEFDVQGQVLEVKAKELIKYNQTPTVKVIITYTKLRTLKVRRGAAAFTEKPIQGDKLEIRFASGASGELDIIQNTLEVGVSEGADLTLTGETGWQEVKVATGGTLSAYKLVCNNSVVKANTGGSAKVMATESIDASANTGASITYKGDPKKVREKDGLSGTVKSY